jgi:hypothetical protein
VNPSVDVDLGLPGAHVAVKAQTLHTDMCGVKRRTIHSHMISNQPNNIHIHVYNIQVHRLHDFTLRRGISPTPTLTLTTELRIYTSIM